VFYKNQLNENTMKHNYKFIVKIFCSRNTTSFGPKGPTQALGKYRNKKCK